MNPRTAYLVQVIEKIGGPLLDAVTSQSEALSKEQAEQLAVLLSKTVQLSINLGKMIEVEKTEPEMSDSLRLAMAGLASPIIASQYKNLSKAPSDDDMSKLGNALEAVMTFSDNFTPSPENAERLKNLQAQGQSVDVHQTHIQYIQAFVPVADVISRFPFGQAEKKMVQDAAEKITAKAKAIREQVFSNTQDADTQKIHELSLVKALSDLYTSCHTFEMEKLLKLQEPDANAQGEALKRLWEGFDMRADTLQTLAENLIPQTNASTSSSSNTVAPAAVAAQATAQPPQSAAQTPPATPPQTPPQNPVPSETPPANQQTGATPPPIFQKPPEQQAPATPPAAAPPQQPPATPPQAPPTETQQSSGNPMSMFAQPKNDVARAGAATPPPEQPPVQPQEQQATSPPVQPPAAPPIPPTQPPAENPPAEDAGGQASGSPMSFFKTPPKDGEEQ